MRCVDTSLTEADHLNAPERWHARVRLWTAVAHGGKGQDETTCAWCIDTIDNAEEMQLHDTWFVGLLTCVRASDPTKAMDVLTGGGAPPFREQLSIYSSHPSLPGWANMPAVHACARFPYNRLEASVPADRAVDQRESAEAEAGGQQ